MPAGSLDAAERTALGQKFPELRLLVLHGSRARGTFHVGSDWDFGYLADRGLDELGLRASLSLSLGTNDVDLVDLRRASAVLRYRVAAEGKSVLERKGDEFERFALDAIRFWLDVAPIVEKAHAELLERLG
jgi:predicted nucleotidyltransferase